VARLLMPTRRTVHAVAAIATGTGIALLVTKWRDLPEPHLALVGGGLFGALALACVVDAVLTALRLRRHPIVFERQMPSAFALGQPHGLTVTLAHEGLHPWSLELFDHVPATMTQRLLPARVVLPAKSQLDVRYEITPTQRGKVVFEPAAIRVCSLLGLVDLQLRVGESQGVHVYPNFAALSRYAWLAGDRRLAEIGIKTYAARGAGTDFKQLGEYVPGMPTRHIDWNASMRHRRPVVREFQDDRDQSVVFLLDCGRRMRADERSGTSGSHFDQALNAAMLLAYVALKDGDAVGALTFGHDASEQRHFAPAKGIAALNTLVARLHDIEPSPTHSDYLAAARDLMLRVRRRSLIVVLTNFRDEDCEELEDALRLMRTRHLVLLASLREGVVAEIAAQPLDAPGAIVDVAAAHWFQNARAEAFRRLAGKNQLLVDTEPDKLAAALVNRYHAVKRARLL